MEKSQIWLAFRTLTLLLASALVDKEVGQDKRALVELYAPRYEHCKKLAPEYEKLKAGFKKAKSILVEKVDCDEVILDETKAVLVEFYAPWCSHCKNLAPAYVKVTTSFKMKEDVIIDNVDVDKKDLVEKYGISGFPILKFFPKVNKVGEDYDGGKNLDDFVTFINEKCGPNCGAKGQLTSKAGILSSFDALVKEFVVATIDERKVKKKKKEIKSSRTPASIKSESTSE